MRVSIHHRCADFNSYRAARVKSLFNVGSGADVYIDADLPLDARPWQTPGRALRSRLAT